MVFQRWIPREKCGGKRFEVVLSDGGFQGWTFLREVQWRVYKMKNFRVGFSRGELF